MNVLVDFVLIGSVFFKINGILLECVICSMFVVDEIFFIELFVNG